MSVFHIIALLIVLAAVISYINHKWLKLPSSAGLTLTSLGVAFFLWVLSATHVIEFSAIVKLVHSIHFNEVVLHGMLAFLLFSSALFINLDSFKRWLFLIIGLSSIGILISAFITGITLYYFLHFCNIEVPFIWTLIFGALIAPTDVLSVSTILERVGVSSDLKIKLIGESLFNDSVSIMLFLVIYGFIVHTNTTMADLPYIFFKELIGGLLVGYVLGKTTLSALKAINSYSTEIFMTLALAVGSYAIGEMLHVSAAVATVVAGLVIGGHTKNEDITDKTRKHMAVFWEILERVLNDVLFVLIGLEILVITFTKEHLFIGGWAVICSLFGRLIGVVVSVIPGWKTLEKGTIPVLTWGGLKGGISFALALSLPESPYKEPILFATFFVIIVASIGQALTLGWLIKHVAAVKKRPKKVEKDISPEINEVEERRSENRGRRDEDS